MKIAILAIEKIVKINILYYKYLHKTLTVEIRAAVNTPAQQTTSKIKVISRAYTVISRS
jgi:hypothetical protein